VSGDELQRRQTGAAAQHQRFCACRCLPVASDVYQVRHRPQLQHSLWVGISLVQLSHVPHLIA